MTKFIKVFLLALFFGLILIITVLSTVGLETSKFNNLITQKINSANKNINLELKSVKYKFDIKELSLFLDTKDPNINYRKVSIPAENIKVYIDFLSFINVSPQIKKINLTLNQIEIEQLKLLSISFKPSTFTSFLKNNILKGKLNTEIEVFLDKNNTLDNFIARGSVENLEAKIVDNFNLNKTNFSFFADKTDVLVKKFSSELGPLKIEKGDIQVKFLSEISISSNFQSILKGEKIFEYFPKLIENYKYLSDISKIETKLSNSLNLSLDKTYKIKKYSFKSTGNIFNTVLNFKSPIESNFIKNSIENLSLRNSKFETNINSKKIVTKISGEYSINKSNYLSFNLKNEKIDKLYKTNLLADYEKDLNFDIINYKKKEGKIAKILINLEKYKSKTKFNKINFTENKNSFVIEGLKFENEKFKSIEKILVQTFKNDRKNNDFLIEFGKKILIRGSQFDATNFVKALNKNKKNNEFKGLNKEIEIDLINITAPLTEKLRNFKLIGKIENGNFSKISSKGDFGNNHYLDISMKNDKKNKKKYLEIYSDKTKPLLTEYSFFNGLTGGNLIFTSVIDQNLSISKLKIENFKVVNAPGMVKLLSLADLGGLADLAQGEGLSFDILEISMEKSKENLKLNEILALGPSISVLMEGYQDSQVTSLRGTLVPAKTLNKMISKIPVIGDIVIPKEIGEGLFGISFKMKGPTGNIKTTINPIRTITPRFIQKIVDRNKKSK